MRIFRHADGGVSMRGKASERFDAGRQQQRLDRGVLGGSRSAQQVSGECLVADTLLRRLDAEAEGGGGHAWRYTIDGGATSSPNDLVDSCARFAFSECHEARDRPRDMENAEFERLVAEALDDIPAEFARLLANVTVVVEEEPPPRLLLALGLDPARESLYGLYQGVPLSRRPHDFAGLPDRITIFAGPLLRNCPKNP